MGQHILTQGNTQLCTQSPMDTARSVSDPLTVTAADLEFNNGEIQFQIPVKNPPPPDLTFKCISARSFERSTNSSIGSPCKTMRDYCDNIKALKKENFDLKLRIFLLEERLNKGAVNLVEKPRKAEDDQSVSYRTRFSNCVALVEEAADAIEILENKLETQKLIHKEEINKIEKKLEKYEDEHMTHADDNFNNNMDITNTCCIFQENFGKKSILSTDSEVQCDLGLPPSAQEAYCESVRLFRKVVGRLEAKLSWAEEEWKEVEQEVFGNITEGKIIKEIFKNKGKILANICNTENVYDETDDDDDTW